MKSLTRSLTLTFLVVLTACRPTPRTSQPVNGTTGSSPTQTSQATSTPSPTETPQPTATEIPATLESTPTPQSKLQTGQSLTLTNLHMIDAAIGWGLESSGHIVHTKDGGLTWKDVTPPQGTYNEGGFFALDADTAWATPHQNDCYDASCLPLSENGIVYRTDDGGKTWKASQPFCLSPSATCPTDYDVSAEYYSTRQMQFLDEKTGWLLVSVNQLMFQDRYRLYKTTDGGENWTFVIDNLQGPLAVTTTGIAFLNKKTGWLGISQVGGPLDPAPNWYINKTVDGGTTWSVVKLPEPSPLPDTFAKSSYWCGASKIHVIPPQTIDLTFYCDVYDGNSRPRYSFHFHTSNSGENWQSWPETGGADFINPIDGWRLSVKENGGYNLEKTNDGGFRWAQVKTVQWGGSLDFVDEQNGWALATAGDVTTLVRTTNGGKTWTDTHPMVGSNVEDQPHTAIFLGNLQRTGVYETGSAALISGKLRWKETLSYAYTSLTAIDGVIYYGSDSGLLAVDSDTGQVKWSHPRQLLFFGAAPTVSEGIVYFSEQGVDNKNNDISCLYALDITTGHEKWNICTAGWASRISPAISNGLLYFGGDAGFWALDAQTGVERWRFLVSMLGSPALADGKVYVNARDGHLYVLTADLGEVLWKFNMGRNYNYTTTTPAIANGRVYVSGYQYLYALDAKTGQEQWKFEAGRDLASIVADGRVVYFVSSSGYYGSLAQNVYALDAFTGQIKWKFDLSGSRQAYSSPALSNGVLYVGTNTGLYTLDAKTGQEKWKFSEYGMVTAMYGEVSSPVIADGVLYFVFGQNLYAIK